MIKWNQELCLKFLNAIHASGWDLPIPVDMHEVCGSEGIRIGIDMLSNCRGRNTHVTKGACHCMTKIMSPIIQGSVNWLLRVGVGVVDHIENIGCALANSSMRITLETI